jgi:restriction system protein
MTIPGYQKFMLPLLKFASDGKEHSMDEIFNKIADYYSLSADDRSEPLSSGRQSKFENRVHWAKTYLTKAGLLESTGRAIFRITSRGQDALEGNPNDINVKYLSKYPEFIEFRSRTHKVDKKEEGTEDEMTSKTPEEMLEESYQNLRRSLTQELIETVKHCSPRFFENLVVDLLVAMGYGGSRKDAGSAIGRTGDGGIDGIIKEDKLGLDIVYIQAKKWENTVSRPEVQAFAGSLEGFRARKGVMITTSKFTREAQEYVGKIEKKIVLIDGEDLAQMMIDHGIGVTEINNYVIKRIDQDYFEE